MPCRTESALFLGLGAGTLTQACLKFLPLEDVECIELRPDVPRLAIEYMGLEDDPRLYIRVGDALELLPSAETADLIFVDLYTDHGPAPAHLAWRFLEQCQQRLNPHGWLIINQWAGNDGKPLGAALLRGLYQRHYWELPVKEGNVIVMVPADIEQQLDQPGLRQRAEALAPQLGYSLQSLIDLIRRRPETPRRLDAPCYWPTNTAGRRCCIAARPSRASSLANSRPVVAANWRLAATSPSLIARRADARVACTPNGACRAIRWARASALGSRSSLAMTSCTRPRRSAS